MNIEQSIHDYGCISIAPYHSGKQTVEETKSSEDYVGKITAIFSPYISANISENKFIRIQDRVKAVVTEIKGAK